MAWGELLGGNDYNDKFIHNYMMTVTSGRAIISPSLSANRPRSPNIRLSPGLSGGLGDLTSTLLGIVEKIEDTQAAIHRIDENVEEIKPWIPVLIGALAFVGVALILNKRK